VLAFSSVKDTEMRLLVAARYYDDNFSRFDTIQDCDRLTDGQTSCDSIHRAMRSAVREKY